jgi:predicted Zn-dependent peptidase
MRKKIKGPDEVEALVRKVTAKDIQKVAQEIFVDKHLNIALIGPFEDSAVFAAKLKFNA